MLKLLLDFLFPLHSLTGREGEWVTLDECKDLRAEPVVLDAPQLRGLGLTALDRIVAATEYKHHPLLRRAVHAFKYRHVRAFADVLAPALIEASMRIWRYEAPVLCPVPLHWTRKFSRGFNQSALLAERVAAARGCEVRDLLRRRRRTGHQAHRNRVDRFSAMVGAFVPCVPSVPSFVVLIDDLSTTGSTLDACAAALKKAGARRVEGLVVAHG